jgi:hypothetical protein
MAARYGLPVVTVDFIHDCVDEGRILNTDNYILVGRSWRDVLDTTLCDKFVSDLRQVGGFLQVL